MQEGDLILCTVERVTNTMHRATLTVVVFIYTQV